MESNVAIKNPDWLDTFVFIQVDCTANTEVCGKYGVSGYPTLKIFRGGEFAEDYNGAREAGMDITKCAKYIEVSLFIGNSVGLVVKLFNCRAWVVGFESSLSTIIYDWWYQYMTNL